MAKRPLSTPECGFSHALKISHLFLCIVSASKISWDRDPLCRQWENICLMPVSFMSSVVSEGHPGICAAILSACLMAQTKQWVRHRNIWFVDDFNLWATVVACHFYRKGCPINLWNKLPGLNILILAGTDYLLFFLWSLFYNCGNPFCWKMFCYSSRYIFLKIWCSFWLVSKRSEEHFISSIYNFILFHVSVALGDMIFSMSTSQCHIHLCH